MVDNPNIHNFDIKELIPVSQEEFFPGSTLPADVFLKLSESRFILIARQGTKAKFQEMHFTEKGEVDTYYVRKNDYKNCVGQHLVVAGLIINNAQIDEVKKTEFLSKAADAVFKEISDIGINHEALEHAKNVTKSIQTLVEQKSDLFSLVSLMARISDDLIRHSMAVSALSVAIAKGMNWVFPQTLERLALGGLLHDVGLKEISRDIFTKARHEMTLEEVQTFESHVFRGVEILRSMPSISDEIISIVYEHHENALGQGYPRKLRDFKMNPLAKVVALADAFAELCLKGPNNPHPKTAEEAVVYLETTLGQPFHKPAFAGLKSVLNNTVKVSKVRIVG